MAMHETSAGKTFFCAHVGPSMNPTLTAQDLLEIEPYELKRLRTGDVVLLLPPSRDHYVVHRVIGVSPGGIKTRGDNNTHADLWLLKPEDINGRVIAAHQGDTHRKIASGFLGRLTGLSCLFRRKTSGLTVKLLRPVYRSLCTAGLFGWLIPIKLTPQVATFRSGKNDFHKLLLGKRIIGSYDKSLLQWQIKRPYRLFVDESSLPKPR